MIICHGDDTDKDDERDTVADTLLVDALTEPHDKHRAGSKNNGHECHSPYAHFHMATGCLNLILEVHEVSWTLEQKDNHCEITGILVELHSSALSLSLHLLERGENHAEKLDHDRSRDIWHDTQREDRRL